MQSPESGWVDEEGGKTMKKWQIALSIVLGSVLLLFGVGFIMCNFIF